MNAIRDKQGDETQVIMSPGSAWWEM